MPKIAKIKPPKFNVKARKKDLHIAWSFVVRQRDDFTCQWCLHEGKHSVNNKHHGHHIVARSLCGNTGAFEVENGMCLCYHCHMDRIKSEPDEYIAFRDDWLHQRGYTFSYGELREKYTDTTKFTEDFFNAKLHELDNYFQLQKG